MDFNANENEWARISANLVQRLDFHTVSCDCDRGYGREARSLIYASAFASQASIVSMLVRQMFSTPGL